MTAIYWGQLSHCETTSYDIAQYSCTHKSAYSALCTFGVFLFLTQASYTSLVVLWRGDLISEVGLYDELSVPNPIDVAYDVMSYSNNIKQGTLSADL